MSVKNKTLRILICAVLSVLIIYFGICCFATGRMAAEQPYLAAGAVHYHFCGYPMMAAGNGAACVASALVLARILYAEKKGGPQE